MSESVFTPYGYVFWPSHSIWGFEYVNRHDPLLSSGNISDKAFCKSNHGNFLCQNNSPSIWGIFDEQSLQNGYVLVLKKSFKMGIFFNHQHTHIFFFFNCMFYQLLRVQHSCYSTQSWGSVTPSIVETRDQNSQGGPLLFSNRNLGSFCA